MQLLNPQQFSLNTAKCLSPVLADRSFAYIQALSDLLLRDLRCRQYPDLLALGFWLRAAHLQEVLRPYSQLPYTLRPLGLVFHNAPANVDSLFMYPALLSLLMGNQNLIRLSNRAGGSATLLLILIKELSYEFPDVNKRLIFIKAEHGDNELNLWLQRVDGRLLWGSDAAIIAQRAIPVPAHCRDLTFAHKFSLCLLNANAVLNANETALSAMQALFVRDHLTYAQQTCASAKLVVWLGEPTTAQQAQLRFWPALETLQRLTDSEHYQALSCAQQLILSSENYKQLQMNTLVRLTVSTTDTTMIDLHTGGGLFLEMTLPTLSDLTTQLHSAHQTISYWGVPSQELAQWQQEVLIGLDRIVPLGQSLLFNPIWDGMDLPLQLCKISSPIQH